MKSLPLAVMLGAAGALLVAVACSDPAGPATCVDIPSGGCPEDNGADVCADPTCSAVYGCVDGQWQLAQKCRPRPMDAATDADSEAGVESGPPPVFDANIDVPPGAGGGPGCVDLELPDCSVDEGLTCADSLGCCGCIDLWDCQDGSWVLWGECTDAGIQVAK